MEQHVGFDCCVMPGEHHARVNVKTEGGKIRLLNLGISFGRGEEM